MASGPITAWQIEKEKVEVVTDFFFLSSKITEDGDCSHEIRRWLLLGRKAMKNLVCWKGETLLCWHRSVESSLSVVFPVITYCCESWTIKKAECQRIDTFKLWCRRRLLKVHWRARRSNQSILREMNPEYSLEGLMLKLKLQYFGHLMRTDDWWLTGKVPDAGKDQGQKEKRVSEDKMAGRHHQCNEHELGQTLVDGEGQGVWHAAVHGVAESQTHLGNWKTTTKLWYWSFTLRFLTLIIFVTFIGTQFSHL